MKIVSYKYSNMARTFFSLRWRHAVLLPSSLWPGKGKWCHEPKIN